MNALNALPILLASMGLLIACGEKQAPSSQAPSPFQAPSSIVASSIVASSTSPAAPETDKWLGKWNGPEGTFIEISGGHGSYIIIIANLDGPTQYTGTSNGSQITFERDGTTEIIQASNGADTGMKWLADKTNCLRVRLGEGWCRD